jgi:tetratricopeptide (TPR) repeat protein
MRIQGLSPIVFAVSLLFYLACAASLAAPHSLADTMFEAANSADIAEQYDDAARKYKDVIVKFRESDPDNPFRLRAKARLARVYILQGKFNEAEPIFSSLILVCDRSKLDSIPELMIDLDDLSEAYWIMPKEKKYRYESLKRCVELRKRINPNHPRLVPVYRDLAEYTLVCNNSDESITWINKAMDMERKLLPVKQFELPRDLSFLASLYYVRRDYNKAQQAAESGIALLRRFPSLKLLATQLHTTLGRIYTAEHLYDKANIEYQTALTFVDRSIPDGQAIYNRITEFSKTNSQERLKTSVNRH